MFITYESGDQNFPGIWWICSEKGELLLGFNTDEEAEEALSTLSGV